MHRVGCRGAEIRDAWHRHEIMVHERINCHCPAPSSKDVIELDFIHGTTPKHEFPSLFTQNIDTIMRVNNNLGRGSLLQEVMQDELLQSGDENDDGNSLNCHTGAEMRQRWKAAEVQTRCRYGGAGVCIGARASKVQV